MASRNGVLLVQCSDLVDIQKLAADLCGVVCVREQHLIQRLTWKISNKYYEADLDLMTTKGTWQDLKLQDELKCVDGLVLAFDPTEGQSFDLVKLWLGFVDEHQPAILLLVCSTFPSGDDVAGGVSRQAALEWCIEHSFELVELSAEIENEDQQEECFVEKVGVARISEALQTNMWSNMRRKAPPQENAAAAVASKSEEGDSSQPEHTSSQRRVDALLPEDLPINAALSDDDPGGESFEKLFEAMMEMKEKAASLPEEARKEYAEKVALSFWQALGGDELESDEEAEQ